MATTFQITAPDGTQYQVQGPDGATEEQALAQVRAQHEAPPENGGILKNAVAGPTSTITWLAGQVVNALNPIPHIEGILHPGIYSPKQRMQDMSSAGNAVTHGANEALGAVTPSLNPENVTANTFPEKLTRGITSGLTGGALLGGGTVGQVLANMATGGISGAGAATGAEIAPEGYKPLGATVGALLAPMATMGAINGVNAAKNALFGPIPESSVNSVVTDAINELGNSDAPASDNMLARLQAAQKAAKVATAAKWTAAGVDETTPLPKDILQGRVNDYLGTLSTANRQNIPGHILDTLKDIPPDGATLGEIQDWRSNIGDEVAGAFRAGLGNKGRVIGGLQKVVGDFLDEIPQNENPSIVNTQTENGVIQRPGAPPISDEQLAAYKDARTATRTMKQTFNQPGSPVATALSPREFGAAAESNTANLFLKPQSNAGALEAFDAYMKAVGNDPQGLQAARDAFAQKFLDAIQTTGTDEAGNATISTKAISKFLEQYSHVTDSNLFSTDQKSILDAISNVANKSNIVTGRRFIDVLARRLAAPTTGAIIGSTGGIPGAIAGAAAGEGVNRILTAMGNAPRDAAVRTLAGALSNPSMATALLKPATNAAASGISLPVQVRIFSALLGKTANDNASRKVRP